MMNPLSDDRIPVRFGAAGPDDAALIEGDLAVSPDQPLARFRLIPGRLGHPFGCVCCVPRGPVADALGRLFLARACGEVRWFCAVAVLASPAGEAAVRAALAEDRIVAARFRLDDDPSGRMPASA
jgi:hypothetical protein